MNAIIKIGTYSIILLASLACVQNNTKNTTANTLSQTDFNQQKNVQQDTILDDIKTISLPHLKKRYQQKHQHLQDKKGNTLLHLAARFNTNDNVILYLIQQKQALNKTNQYGMSAFHIITAARSYPLFLAAIKANGNINDKVVNKTLSQFILEANGVKNRTNFKYKGDYFSVIKKQGVLNKGNIHINIANELIDKLVYIKRQQYKQVQLNKHQPLVTAYKKQRKQNQEKNQQLKETLPEIALPIYPEKQKIVKGPFENKQLFDYRLQGIKDERQQIIKDLTQQYKQQVAQRAQTIIDRKKQSKTIEMLMDNEQNQFTTQEQTFAQQLEEQIEKSNKIFIVETVAQVYGSPNIEISKIKGQPKYNPETGKMHANVYYEDVDITQNIVFTIAAGEKAKSFYEQLNAGKLNVKTTYKFNQDEQIVFVQAKVNFEDENLIGKPQNNQNFELPKPTEVILNQKKYTPVLVQPVDLAKTKQRPAI